MELLGQLSAVRRCATVLAELEMREMSRGDSLPTQLQNRATECGAEMEAAEKELRRTLAPAAVFLSPATHQAVAELLGLRESIMANTTAPFDFYDEWGAETGRAYKKVLSEAQRELRAAFDDESPSAS